MPKILLLNGPNLNLTGLREPEVYGSKTFEDFLPEMRSLFPETELIYAQSNVEGELINILHEYGFTVDGIILNPGAYAHTSVAIADAIRSVSAPVIEVHMSNVFAREAYRHTLLSAAAAKACISGMGMQGYVHAMRFLLGQ
jgi:3-dehydroquinate dehydratase II